MPRNRFSLFLLMGLFLIIGAVVACGGAAAPDDATAPAAPAGQAPVASATEVPEAMAMEQAGTLIVATRALRSGAGTPMFCTAGCAETIYLGGIMETLTGVEDGPPAVLSIPGTPRCWPSPGR